VNSRLDVRSARGAALARRSLHAFSGRSPYPLWRSAKRVVPATTLGVVSTLLFLGATPIAQAAPPANIDMTVPADASVWIEGQATNLQGVERHFVSPALEAGAHYSYTIRVQWTEGSKTVERSRRIRFESGDQIRINLARGDEPTIDVTVARTAPAPVRVSPTTFAPESNPPIVRYSSGPSYTPGLSLGSLSGPGPAGLERR
jgi:uncharacterized protein (TIGR03000 family)